MMENDVALKILHTADWHLGAKFKQFRDSDAEELSRARIDVLARIFAMAERNNVDAVLCAGDLFDTPMPEPVFWQALVATLVDRKGWEHRPVFLLPGNHDPLIEQSVFHPHHAFRQQLPDWVHVVDRDDFSYPLKNDAMLYARPCRSRSGDGDNALRLPKREPGDTHIRIGMVHGSTFDAPGFESNFPIAKGAAVARGLDYLALGDTHNHREVEPDAKVPTLYPGAPEAVTFGEPGAGYVAIVLFPHGRRRAIIRKEKVASWTWRQESCTSLQDLKLLQDQDLRKCVLRLTLDMALPHHDFMCAQDILDALQGNRARHGKVGVFDLRRDRFEVNLDKQDPVLEDLPDVLRGAAERLLQHDDAVARRALTHLLSTVREAQAEP